MIGWMSSFLFPQAPLAAATCVVESVERSEAGMGNEHVQKAGARMDEDG